MSDKTAENSVLFLKALIAFIISAIFIWLFSMLDVREQRLMESGVSGGVISKVYGFISLETHLPETFKLFTIPIQLKWFLAYSIVFIPVFFLAFFMINKLADVIFKKNQPSLIEDPEYEAIHAGIDTEEMNFIDYVLEVIPNSHELRTLRSDIARNAIQINAPKSASSDLDKK